MNYIQSNKNDPYFGCIIVTSLIYLLNEQLENCTNEFMRLNNLALNCANEFKIRDMMKHYNNMLTIVEYLEPISEYLYKYHHNEIFFRAMFSKHSKPSKEIFEEFNKLYNSQKHSN